MASQYPIPLKKTAKPAGKSKGTYCLKGVTGPIYNKALLETVRDVIKQLNLNWWDDLTDNESHLPDYHVTIAMCKGKLEADHKEKADADQIETEIAIFGTQVEASLLNSFQNSVFLLPHSLEITKNGWIILTLSTLKLAKEDHEVLNRLQNGFVKLGKEKGFKFNDDHINHNFKPHISIGYVKCEALEVNKIPGYKNLKTKEERDILRKKHQKAVLDAAVLRAQKTLTANMSTFIINKLKTIRMLNLYQLALSYTSRHEALINAKGESVVISKILAPRDYGVLSCYRNSEGIFLIFNSKEDCDRCGLFLLQLNITSRLDKQKPKTTRVEGKKYKLLLSIEEYRAIAGMIKKCHVDFSDIKSEKAITYGMNASKSAAAPAISAASAATATAAAVNPMGYQSSAKTLAKK